MRDAGAPSIRMGATAPITPPVTAMGATPQGPTSGIWDITSPGGSTIITASRVNASRRWAIRWAGSSSDTPSRRWTTGIQTSPPLSAWRMWSLWELRMRARPGRWVSCSSLQCVQMRGNVLCDGASASAFIQWLRAYAWDPDGVGSSQWTLLGSQADLTVPSNCALRNMAAYGRTKYLLSSGVSHAEYIHLTSENDTADVRYKRGSSDWTTDYTSPWPVKWSRLALSETTW